MVAFCGGKITEQNVMDVFGFTSAETVSGLAGHLFARDATAALGLVVEQSEAGKDLSRLTTNLIAHLRDLLVAQASGKASAIPQGKLLDLIDHFSEAETRMKWVADKKLQLDVAVIKALHLLDETSLTDVIETLEELRGGNSRTPAPRPAATPSPVEKRAEPTFDPPLVAEQPKSAKRSADPEAALVSAATTWESLAETFASDSLVRFGWLREGLFERLDGENLFVRFPATAKDSSETVFMEQGRKDIELRLAREFGRPIRLVLEFDGPAGEPEPPMEEPETAAPVAAQTADPVDDFKNDPFIKKALEIFKGTLQASAP
jgi:DNA polymerase-3 subunit gamma/tau